jgi:hypothetical protein
MRHAFVAFNPLFNSRWFAKEVPGWFWRQLAYFSKDGASNLPRNGQKGVSKGVKSAFGF